MWLTAEARPTQTLEFQLRRCWPNVPYIAADRWDTTVSRSLPQGDQGSAADVFVVELTRRDSQFRRTGTGWIVDPVGEPRRYHGEKLTMHRVRLQTP